MRLEVEEAAARQLARRWWDYESSQIIPYYILYCPLTWANRGSVLSLLSVQSSLASYLYLSIYKVFIYVLSVMCIALTRGIRYRSTDVALNG